MITLTSKVNTITEQYLERFGKARVAVYHLVISQQEPFSSFLNALMITLRRKDLMPCYTWFSTRFPIPDICSSGATVTSKTIFQTLHLLSETWQRSTTSRASANLIIWQEISPLSTTSTPD